MAKGKLIGPKCSQCCMITSVWGVIMLSLMGGAFYLYSPALYDDLPVVYTTYSVISNKTTIFNAYKENGMNCFIAAGLYVIVFVFSFWQYRVNKSLQAYTIR